VLIFIINKGLATPITASPLAGMATGGTVVTFSAPNIEWTQFAVSINTITAG
jgi:hypothetical protein